MNRLPDEFDDFPVNQTQHSEKYDDDDDDEIDDIWSSNGKKYTSLIFLGLLLVAFLFHKGAFSRHEVFNESLNAPVAAHRAFIALQRVSLSSSVAKKGEQKVKLVLSLPDGRQVALPSKEGAWTAKVGGDTPLSPTLRVPAAVIKDEGFSFTVQMEQEGVSYQPCHFKVTQTFQYNRTYICHGLVSKQIKDPNEINMEVEISVFSDATTLAPENRARLSHAFLAMF